MSVARKKKASKARGGRKKPTSKAVRAARARLDKLNVSQALFVLKYVELGNATQAALEAGYSKRTARVQASRLLSHPGVSAAVGELRNRIAEGAEITIERIVLELKRILVADIGEAFREDDTIKPLLEWPADLRKACSGFDVEEIVGTTTDPDTHEITRGVIGHLKKVRFWAKDSAADKLLKKLGGYAPEKHEHSMSFAALVANAGKAEDE